jgi:hypothetical protein
LALGVFNKEGMIGVLARFLNGDVYGKNVAVAVGKNQQFMN